MQLENRTHRYEVDNPKRIAQCQILTSNSAIEVKTIKACSLTDQFPIFPSIAMKTLFNYRQKYVQFIKNQHLPVGKDKIYRKACFKLLHRG